jgi:enoyl-CoA hydratase/carnithine racemase
MSFDVIQYKTDGPLALVSLNRPNKLNAINEEPGAGSGRSR